MEIVKSVVMHKKLAQPLSLDGDTLEYVRYQYRQKLDKNGEMLFESDGTTPQYWTPVDKISLWNKDYQDIVDEFQGQIDSTGNSPMEIVRKGYMQETLDQLDSLEE